MNIEIINEFLKYMRNNSSSEHHQNNNFKNIWKYNVKSCLSRKY